MLLSVRYGAKAIEFEKGKDAVLLADVRELATVLPKLIAATEAGELDTHINAVMKVKQPICKFASNSGSDSLSLIFGGGVVLFSKGNQQHDEEFGRFVPDAGRSGR